MEKTIDYLEELGLSLSNLARMCTVLSLVQEHPSRPSVETFRDCFHALEDILDTKAQEIEEVVSKYYKARARKPAIKP